MAKLTKHLYYNKSGEAKINCYGIHISKEVVEKAGLENKQVKVYEKDNKIIIEEKK